jgi:hypothetical protein
LLTVTVPPVSLMPLTVSVAEASVNETLPLVPLVALKALTALPAFVSVMPAEALATTEGTVIAPVSVMEPAEVVRFSVPEPLMAFVTLMLLLRL